MMLPKELLQVLKLSGGKVIVSEGEIEESYVVMSLAEYLKEQERLKEKESFSGQRNDAEGKPSEEEEIEEAGNGLTNEALLDRINADIEELRQRKNEIELEQELEQAGKKDGSDIRYEEVR